MVTCFSLVLRLWRFQKMRSRIRRGIQWIVLIWARGFPVVCKRRNSMYVWQRTTTTSRRLEKRLKSKSRPNLAEFPKHQQLKRRENTTLKHSMNFWSPQVKAKKLRSSNTMLKLSRYDRDMATPIWRSTWGNSCWQSSKRKMKISSRIPWTRLNRISKIRRSARWRIKRGSGGSLMKHLTSLEKSNSKARNSYTNQRNQK